jgi:hypothetical protein
MKRTETEPETGYWDAETERHTQVGAFACSNRTPARPAALLMTANEITWEGGW